MSKKALVVSFSDLSRDPRVWKQLLFLTERGFEVTAVGEKDPQMEGVEFIDCKTLPKNYRNRFGRVKRLGKILTRRYESLYWSQPHNKQLLSTLKDKTFDLLISNELESLPLVVKLKKSGKVYFDAHEYAPREFEDVLQWRLLIQPFRHYLCRTYLKEADFRTTVCQGIAEEYKKNFGSSFEILTNAAFYHDLSPKPVDENCIKMIYHGCATASRSCEEVLKIMDLLDERFVLDMVLVPGCPQYIQEFKQKAQHYKNIRFIDPVPMQEISKMCNQYDIGFFPLLPLNINYYFGLGNKTFEFIQARVAHAISPLPEMGRVIRENHLGVIAEDFTPKAFASMLNNLSSKQIWEMKMNNHQVARQLSAEANFDKLNKIIGFSP